MKIKTSNNKIEDMHKNNSSRTFNVSIRMIFILLNFFHFNDSKFWLTLIKFSNLFNTIQVYHQHITKLEKSTKQLYHIIMFLDWTIFTIDPIEILEYVSHILVFLSFCLVYNNKGWNDRFYWTSNMKNNWIMLKMPFSMSMMPQKYYGKAS